MSFKSLARNVALCCVLSLYCYSAHTQNWDKGFSKSDVAYELGDYKKAQKFNLKVKKKALKKLGQKSNILALALVREAKINTALGVLTEVEDPLNQAIMLNEELNLENKVEFGYLLKEAAQVMILYGNFNLADSYLQQAKSSFEEAGVIEELIAELDVLSAKILAGRGFYSQAIDLVDNQTEFFQNKISSASKKEADIHKKEFAEILLVKSNAYRMMGDYLKSDSSFLYTENWIDNNLGKSDILYAQCKYLNAKLLQENGLARDAQADLFEKAYIAATKKYPPSHMITMEIKKDLMNSYYAVGSTSKLKIVNEEFKKTLNSSFPNNSVHSLADDLRDLYFKFEAQELRVLEEKINKLLNNDLVPRNHSIRIELYDFANDVALFNGRHRNTDNYQKLILGIKEVLYGLDAPVYHLTKIKLANYFIDYSDNFDEVQEIYETSFKLIVDPEITEGHHMYLDILSHLASYYEETDQYEKASETLDRALLAARRKYDDKDVEYGKTLEKIAGLQIKIGKYEEAENNLNTAINIFDELKSEVGDANLSVAYITQAKLLAIKGEYDEAEANIWYSDKLRSKLSLTVATAGLGYQDDLADLYLNIGRFTEANQLLKSSLKEKTKDYGRESRHLNKPLVLTGRLNLLRGEYSEAEQLARRANNLSTSIFGEESSKVVPSSILLATIYTSIGDYDKAESLLTSTIEIQKRQFGEDHVDVGKSLMQLALVKYYKSDPIDLVTKLFHEAEDIIGMRLGKNNPTYAEILKNMAIASIAVGDYTIAFTQLEDAGRIWNKKIGKRGNLNAASVDVLKGDIYYRQKQYNEADNLYEKAKSRYQRFFNNNHPEYVKVQSKLSKTYYMKGNWNRAQSQIEDVLSNYKSFIEEYFPALSEREKAKFWNTIKTDYEFYNTLIISKNRNEKYIGEMFNNALLTKALLLNTSIKIRERILNSGDEDLVITYQEWINKKELLTAALSMSSDQLVENEINTGQLSQEVELLEKELSLKSEIFSEGYEKKAVTWQNIRESLDENEVAIESVRFRVFDHTFTDSVKYALLYIKGGKRTKPGLILLDNGKDLETKYLNVYRNSIKYQIRDNTSYNLYWKPIDEVIGTVSTMYFSPDGVFNQINLEAIPAWEDDGKYVLDNSNIVLVNNTKDLYFKKVKSELQGQQQVATMFGNPVFYIETSPGVPKPNSGLTRETTSIISELPGTKKEIDELKTYLERKGWTTSEYTELDANENTIKSIDNPRIFHIATHGFFQSEKLEASALDAELNENYLYENPLLKSGLLLSGAGDILNETQFNYNVDNGILTAYEAMNLNLDQTDLVVLSACETGLGEVEAGEGVYGLQRAFLVAGAKTVVMSLFKVSDEATQQLMVKFYRKWLETGDKRQSFIDAKKEIRNEYRDPIYWGPFVMIGLD